MRKRNLSLYRGKNCQNNKKVSTLNHYQKVDYLYTGAVTLLVLLARLRVTCSNKNTLATMMKKYYICTVLPKTNQLVINLFF